MFTKKNLHLGQHLIDYNIYQFMCPIHGFGDELEKNSGVKLDTFIFIKEKKMLVFILIWLNGSK